MNKRVTPICINYSLHSTDRMGLQFELWKMLGTLGEPLFSTRGSLLDLRSSRLSRVGTSYSALHVALLNELECHKL